jgi:nucleotide-binding universal stress UspA family protein
MQLRTILVPTDFSPDARRALELAIELAKPSGAAIHLVHSSYFGAELRGLPEPLGIPQDFAEAVQRRAQSQLEELEKVVAGAGLPCTSQVRESSPIAAILDEVERRDADLIVMGTKGLSGFKHVLLGSVAERTVRLAPCPVLTVRAPA